MFLIAPSGLIANAIAPELPQDLRTADCPDLFGICSAGHLELDLSHKTRPERAHWVNAGNFGDYAVNAMGTLCYI